MGISDDPLHICAAARLAQADLIEVDRQLSAKHNLDGQWVLLVKLALVSVANLDDLEKAVRPIYVRHPGVSVEYKKFAKHFGFAKYVRNILVGHTNEHLIAKSIEWKPELRSLLLESRPDAAFLTNLFILETAINTYVDQAEKHLIFDSETDLVYPPDWHRFLTFLEQVVRGGLGFLGALIEAVQAEIPPSPHGDELKKLYEAAGQTTFRRITKTGK